MKRIQGGCRWLAAGAGALILLLLLGWCLTRRVYITQNCEEQAVFLKADARLYALLTAGAVMLLLLRRIWGRLSERNLFLMCTALYLAAGFYLITNVDPILRADAQEVFQAALQCNAGDFSSLNRGNYMAVYPHQLGLMTLHRIWLSIAGIGRSPQAVAAGVQILFAMNLCYVIGINFLTWRISRLWFDRESTSKYAIVLSFLFFPQLFLILFVYGLLPGMLFLLAAVFFLTRYFQTLERNSRRVYFGLTVAMAALCVIVRNNYMIGVLALIAVVFLKLLSEKRRRDLALLFCLILTLAAPNVLVKPCYQLVSGNEIDGGMPMSLYAAMAMQEGSRGNGWYNGYSIRVYENTGCDREASDQIARRDIADRLKEFQEDPGYALDFYSEKIQSTWCDPTFQSIWSGPLLDRGQKTHTPLLQEIYSAGPAYEAVAVVCQAVVIALMAFALAALFLMMREGNGTVSAAKQPELLFPVIFLTGGFLFHILWEAKSQYVSVYIFALVLLAAYGVDRTAQRLTGSFLNR